MSQTILISGGAGFVGSNLAVFLKNNLKTARIICLDNLVRAGSEVNRKRLSDHEITFIQGDVRDKEKLLQLPAIDLLIDCSAEPSVLASCKDPQYAIDTNLLGTIHCLELARRDQAGFIFLSTSRVYPIHALNEIPFEESSARFDWPARARGTGYSYKGIDINFPLSGAKSLYGATKLASEQILIEYLDMYSLKGVINRLSVIAGPWQMGRVDQGIVGYWVVCHKYGKELAYIGFGGGGKQVRDVVHIDDVCDLILYQIQHLDKVDRKIFNAGGGRKNSVSLLELTRLTQKITKTKMEIRSQPENRQGDIRIYITDNTLIEEELGWSPRQNVETIVADVNAWLDTYERLLEPVFK